MFKPSLLFLFPLLFLAAKTPRVMEANEEATSILGRRPSPNSTLPPNNPQVPTPSSISWLDLRDVIFEKKWNDEVRMLLDVPNFGPSVRALDGKKVEISGFVIPYDKSSDLWVLSENPFASCFFCGGAGPETVMSLYFIKASDAGLHTDDYVKVSGVFRINERDVFELAYRLEDVKVVE